MFSELVGWYTGREENRRRYPRVKKEYSAECSIDGGRKWLPLEGVDLSGGGMCVNSDRELPKAMWDLRMYLEGKQVKLKALPVWNTEIASGKKAAFCYGLQFTSIAGSDWEMIMKTITGSGAIASGAIAAVRLNEGEVAKFVPALLRAKMFGELVKRGRLAEPVRNRPVQAQFDYGGFTTANGHPMHKFTVHSTRAEGKTLMRYSTRFMCSEDGEQVVVLDEGT